MTHAAHTSTTANRRAPRGAMRLVLHPVLHLVLVLGAGLGLAGLDTDAMASAHSAAPMPAIPAPAGVGDGIADHNLFNPSATLDTSRVDDLRHAPESECLRNDGVLTPAGACVDAIVVWESEVDAGVWAYLLRSGYTWSIEHSTDEADALWIPIEMVILGGEGGEDVIAVDPARPLTPRG